MHAHLLKFFDLHWTSFPWNSQNFHNANFRAKFFYRQMRVLPFYREYSIYICKWIAILCFLKFNFRSASLFMNEERGDKTNSISSLANWFSHAKIQQKKSLIGKRRFIGICICTKQQIPKAINLLCYLPPENWFVYIHEMRYEN